MKGLWGFLALAAAGMFILAVYQGLRDLFSQMAATWTVADTAVISSSLGQVLSFGGIILVLVLGYAAWTGANRSMNIRFGSSAPRQPQWTALPAGSQGNEQWAAQGNAVDAAGGWSNGSAALPGARPALPEPQESVDAQWYQMSQGQKVER